MPILSFALVAALTGKPHVLMAMALWGSVSVGGAGIGGFIADLLRRDIFEGVALGAMIGTLIGAALSGALFL